MCSLARDVPGVNARREAPMNEGQKRKLLGRARAHGLDPWRDLPALIARILPGQTLEALGGDQELDRVLAALPEHAAELRSRADSSLEPRTLFEQVKDRRDFDGGWSNAAASFRVRAGNALPGTEALADFLAWTSRCMDLPEEFRHELCRQQQTQRSAVAA